MTKNNGRWNYKLINVVILKLKKQIRSVKIQHLCYHKIIVIS